MKRGTGVLIVATVAYIGLFAYLARRIPPEILFVAGFVLGAVLTGLWLILIFWSPKK